MPSQCEHDSNSHKSLLVGHKPDKGLRTACKLLLDINELGVPAATEFLDLITSQYISDLTRWGAIGARTTESQVHREMVSGLGVPVGFKNGTSMQPRSYLGISDQGIASVLRSPGNPDCHVILRSMPQDVAAVAAKMRNAPLPACLVIDCCQGIHEEVRKQSFCGYGLSKLDIH